ncbi:MAG: polysaccharide deacetylase family protein [Sphingomonadaceae bacterium]|nr:polysaccharide deacetylase family protein [Sphingomonadaceae bacterium]
MIDLPASGSRATFAEGFGPRALLTVDTEEEFDWNGPFRASGHGLDHVARLHKFQKFCEGIEVSPVYLIDWPVATSPLAIEIIGDAVGRGTAEVGIQLHPWVNPPHDEEVNSFNSFAGNLPKDLERAKFLRLRDEIEKNFKVSPKIYRAGRYGLGPNTAALLREAGIPIDSSVRAKFDYSANHGPDFRHHPLEPYWVDADHSLLELPLTTVFWGMLRKQGDAIFPMFRRMPAVLGLLSRMAMLERIALTPEGVTAPEALRAVDIALDDGLPMLVLSFHSPSLVPGNTPYVHNEDDLDLLYDWWRQIYAYLAQRGVRPTTVKEILSASGLE